MHPPQLECVLKRQPWMLSLLETHIRPALFCYKEMWVICQLLVHFAARNKVLLQSPLWSGAPVDAPLPLVHLPPLPCSDAAPDHPFDWTQCGLRATRSDPGTCTRMHTSTLCTTAFARVVCSILTHSIVSKYCFLLLIIVTHLQQVLPRCLLSRMFALRR